MKLGSVIHRNLRRSLAIAFAVVALGVSLGSGLKEKLINIGAKIAGPRRRLPA